MSCKKAKGGGTRRPVRIVVVDRTTGKAGDEKEMRLSPRGVGFGKRRNTSQGVPRTEYAEHRDRRFFLSFFLPGTLDISDGLPVATRLPRLIRV